MHKVVHVSAPFRPLGSEEYVDVPTGEMKPRKFGRGEKEVTRKQKRFVQRGVSDREIDGEGFSQAIQEAVDLLDSEGFEIVSINMITSGKYEYAKSGGVVSHGEGYGWGYGFSYTSGAAIIARKVS